MFATNKRSGPARVATSAILLSLVFCLTGWAQTEEDALRFSFRTPATGSRMVGMAGAGIGGVGDWTALYYNPAALAYLGQNQLVGSLNFMDANSVGTFSQAGTGASRTETNQSRTNLSNLGYVYKVPTVVGSLVFAIGLNQTRSFDRRLVFNGENGANSITDYFMPLQSEFDVTQEEGDDGIFDTDDDVFSVDFYRDLSYFAYETYGIDFDRGLWYDDAAIPFLPAVTNGRVEQRGEVFEEGGISDLSFGGAIEASKAIMVGAAVNFEFGSYSYERIFEEEDVNDDNNGVDFGTTDFNWLRLTERIDTDILGVNARGGISAQVLPNLRLGASIQTPTYTELDETFGTSLETEFDNGDTYDIIDDLPFQGEYRVISPWRFGGGATFSIAGLTASVDAEFIDWTELRMESGPTFDEFYFDDVNRDIRSNMTSVTNLKVGAEYVIGPASLRLGYAMYPTPYNVEDGVNRDREFLTAGVGFMAGDQLQINVGWMRESFGDRYLPYTDVADAPVIDESLERSRLVAGVRFFFD